MMIHFAIVGCGHIASKHIDAIHKTEGAELIALCDTNAARLEQMDVGEHVERFTDMTEMLEQVADIDVVCICTPSGLHANLAIIAAKAGKHVVIEKPLCLTLEDADVMAEVVRESGIKAAVVHPNRYRPAIRQLKRALDEGLFGKLSHVNATVRWNRSQSYYDQAPWRGTKLMDGGVLMNQAIHSLDLLQWLFGPVAKVKSMVDTRIRNIESEDMAVAALRFSSGVLGLVEASTTVYEHNLEESISVFGEHGYAVIGGTTANWIKHWKFTSVPPEQAEALIQEIELDPYGTPGHQCIIEDMVHAIRDNREPVVPLTEGREAIKLVMDIVQNGSDSVSYADHASLEQINMSV